MNNAYTDLYKNMRREGYGGCGTSCPELVGLKNYMVKPGFYNKQDISDAIKRLRAPGALFHFNENGTVVTPFFYKKKKEKSE